MDAHTELSVPYDFEALRCKVEILEDRIRRQQSLIEQLRQQVSSMPSAHLPSFIYASTFRTNGSIGALAFPILVAVGAGTWIAILAWGLWGK